MNTSKSIQINGLSSSPVALNRLIDEIPLGIIVLDSEYRILMMNPTMEVLTGYSREKVRGLHCRNVVRSNFCSRQCPAQEAAAEGTQACREGDVIGGDRQKISVRLTSGPVKNNSGRIVGFIETLEDTHLSEQLDRDLRNALGFGPLIGRSPKMEELFKILPIIAQTDSSVLITGDTGTGKDVVAGMIHKASDRSHQHFFKINCGALPETLLESELFGHKRGAFTGAVTDKPGRLRLAHKGTVYLTGIGDLSLPLQAKLLTFLDDKIVFPIGSTRGYEVDVRVIAATNRDLDQMVRKRRFREDLLFRLKAVQVHLPPLRERNGDLELLMNHFLAVLSSRIGKRINGFSEKVRQKLVSYTFPGNVRELKNTVEYAVNICQADQIDCKHLPPYLFEQDSARIGLEDSSLGMSSAAPAVNRKTAEDMNWNSIERQLIIDALVKANGRRNKAAAILGWGRSTLWRKMKRYGLES